MPNSVGSDEPVFMVGPKLFLNEFGIHHRFESCMGCMTPGLLEISLIGSLKDYF